MAFTGNDVVLYEKRDRKAYITLNRPEAMNALSSSVWYGLREALIDLRDDDDILVAILTGAGGRAFSAGMDLKERTQSDKRERASQPVSTGNDRWMEKGWTELGIWKPAIAAIDGYCLAGGMELALQCDIRIATEQSQFGLPEPRRSLLAGYGMHNLSRMIPLGNALYIHLTGSHIDADTAAKWGIVQEIVPHRDALMERVEQLADDILQCAR